MMKIAVIGTGNVGATLANGWAVAGHRILLGVRDIHNFKGKRLLPHKNITAHGISDAVSDADVVLLAIPPDAVPSVTTFLKNTEEKILIDTTNVVSKGPKGFKNGFEALQRLTPCKHIVKAFNNTGFENMAHPSGIDTFVSGDSKSAKKVVKQLAAELGFAHCYDFGGSDQVALQEKLALAWINLAYGQGMGTAFALNVVKSATDA